MKSFLLYLLLVGVPVTGIVSLIYAGRDIKPPIHVGGNWQIMPPFSDQSCVKTLKLPNSPKLKISQSGLYLAIQLDNETFSGSLNGVSITGQGKPSASADSCSGLNLTATLTKEADQEKLTGFLELDNCSQCPSIPFTALRAPAEKESK